MNRLALFGITALSVSAFADEEIAAVKQSSMNKNNGMQSQNQEMMVNTLTSAAPKSEYGWYLFADALYWHADVGNADWGFLNTDISAEDAISGNNYALEFKWDWGFRVGIGMNMDHDQWDSNFYYTWFYAKNSQAMGGPDNTLGVVFMPLLPSINSAQQSWTIHYSMFDWELGRPYYVSKNLALRPHVGIKGGWINQTRDIHFTNIDGSAPLFGAGSGKFTNDFWGVGASAGVNSLWVLGCAGVNKDHRFSLFGDVAGALMYGHFDNSYSAQFANDEESFRLGIHGLNRNQAVSMLQGMMGLSWDTPFNRNRSHFTFRAGYEFQYWFNQNQFIAQTRGADQSALNYSRYDSDLKLQGLTVDFRFDF